MTYQMLISWESFHNNKIIFDKMNNSEKNISMNLYH